MSIYITPGQQLSELEQTLLRRAEKAERERNELLAACHEAHVTLAHYDIIRRPAGPGQPIGVDWGPVEMLQAELLDKLWSAIIKAQPELAILTD